MPNRAAIRRAMPLRGCLMAVLLSGCAAAPPDKPGTFPTATGAAAQVAALELRVLSSRPEFVTGGDALVEVTTSGASASDALEWRLNGKALLDATALRDKGAGHRLVTGLRDGPNRLEVSAGGRASAVLDLVNHPSTGPVLSGPHMAPYECRTEESGLGPATDANCSAPVRYDWFYRTQAGAYKPLDVEAFSRAFDAGTAVLPEDAASYDVSGRRAPYAVRVESGVLNRSIYRIAVPMEIGIFIRPTGARSQWEWNRRLAASFGGGCGTQYNQGTNQVTAALNDLYLSRGFAFMISTELVNQQHCNQVLQGETLMMLKEHFIETYGVPAWTVGTGGSGGAIQQMVITQMYPGLLDGLQPSLSFPDSTMQTADCGLLQKFWREGGKDWSQAKKTAVEGYSPGTCSSWERSFVPVMKATNVQGCALKDPAQVYDPVRNPKGVRCTVTEMRKNIYGVDPKTGFSRKPQDNVGIQYGLKGLNDGVITVDEFLTLNQQIGGNDVDGEFVAQRSVGDPDALKAVYASGLFNTFAGGTANVPILNYRLYTDTTEPGDIHDRHRDLTIRARLEKANGSSDNQVIWVAPRSPGRGQPTPVDLAPLALDAMTKWLDAMAADPAPLSPAKVVRHKPAGLSDGWWGEDKAFRAERASWDPAAPFNKAFPLHLEPRLVAGAPIANDIMKCQLRPVDMKDYKVPFTAAQTARLKAVFPDGVCDWSKPGVGYSKIAGTYRTY
jgi:hypothetical protein